MAQKSGRQPKKQFPPELQAFANLRGRPALLLFTHGRIDDDTLLHVDSCVDDRTFDELDLVVNSSGGLPGSAFRIMTLLRSRAKRLYACVPWLALSAATQMCLGADRIYVGELSQLGPLDAQQPLMDEAGHPRSRSTQEPFQALSEIANFSRTTAGRMMHVLADHHAPYMPVEARIRLSLEYATALSRPLVEQVKAETLGDYSRGLEMGRDYTKRLLLRAHPDVDPSQIETIVDRFVNDYHDHGFAIDYQELFEMGLPVAQFSEEEMKVVREMYGPLSQDPELIAIVAPEPGDSGPSPEDKPGR